MIHMLNEPRVEKLDLIRLGAEALFGIPVVFDTDVPQGEYKFDRSPSRIIGSPT